MRILILPRATALASLLLPAGLCLAAARYQLEVLPVPPGCHSYAVLHGLDEQQRAVGVLTCDGFVTQRAALWDGAELLELGTLGGPITLPLGINARGQIVGQSDTLEPYDESNNVVHPVVWEGDELRDLGTLGGPLGGALGINGAGVVVGGCQPSDVDPRVGRIPMRACAWDRGRVIDLGDLGGPEAAAYDVNSQGWIVGDSDTSELLPGGGGFARHAFLYDGRHMHDLGTLGGPWGLPFAMNDRGEAVGFSMTGQTSASGFPIWHAAVWKEGRVHDLGTFGGLLSQALDINNRGQIVGWAWSIAPNGATLSRAALWEDDQLIDLNASVLDAEGWDLQSAIAINERGAILANALHEGRWRMVLLLPTPEE